MPPPNMDSEFHPADDGDINSVADALIEGARIEERITRIEQAIHNMRGVTPEELEASGYSDEQFVINLALSRIYASYAFNLASTIRSIVVDQQVEDQQRDHRDAIVLRQHNDMLAEVLGQGVMRHEDEDRLQVQRNHEMRFQLLRQVNQDREYIAGRVRGINRQQGIDTAVTNFTGEINENHICAICLGNFMAGECALPSIITHGACDCRRDTQIYGRECISTWLRDSSTCPTCRNYIMPYLLPYTYFDTPEEESGQDGYGSDTSEFMPPDPRGPQPSQNNHLDVAPIERQDYIEEDGLLPSSGPYPSMEEQAAHPFGQDRPSSFVGNEDTPRPPVVLPQMLPRFGYGSNSSVTNSRVPESIGEPSSATMRQLLARNPSITRPILQPISRVRPPLSRQPLQYSTAQSPGNDMGMSFSNTRQVLGRRTRSQTEAVLGQSAGSTTLGQEPSPPERYSSALEGQHFSPMNSYYDPDAHLPPTRTNSPIFGPSQSMRYLGEEELPDSNSDISNAGFPGAQGLRNTETPIANHNTETPVANRSVQEIQLGLEDQLNYLRARRDALYSRLRGELPAAQQAPQQNTRQNLFTVELVREYFEAHQFMNLLETHQGIGGFGSNSRLSGIGGGVFNTIFQNSYLYREPRIRIRGENSYLAPIWGGNLRGHHHAQYIATEERLRSRYNAMLAENSGDEFIELLPPLNFGGRDVPPSSHGSNALPANPPPVPASFGGTRLRHGAASPRHPSRIPMLLSAHRELRPRASQNAGRRDLMTSNDRIRNRITYSSQGVAFGSGYLNPAGGQSHLPEAGAMEYTRRSDASLPDTASTGSTVAVDYSFMHSNTLAGPRAEPFTELELGGTASSERDASGLNVHAGSDGGERSEGNGITEDSFGIIDFETSDEASNTEVSDHAMPDAEVSDHGMNASDEEVQGARAEDMAFDIYSDSFPEVEGFEDADL